MNEGTQKEISLLALHDQVQVMDAVLTALIATHPHPDLLRNSMKHHLSLLLAHSASRAVAKGHSQEHVERQRRFADNQLRLLD